MRGLGFGFRPILCAVLLSVVAAQAQQPAGTQAGPVPSAILAAKNVFVSNVGPSTEHDSCFSGGPDRVYNEFYAALKKSGQFAMANDPSDADLVLEPGIIDQESGVGIFRIVIYDRKTHFVLWTLIEPIKGCNTQKACDRNLDVAIPAAVLDFEKLTGKVATTGH